MNQKQEELLRRKESLCLGGGEKAIERQHANGKLTARERLELLFDKGTFVEKGLFVKHHCTNFNMDKKETPGEGVVTGHGLVNGRLVYASSQDFTVMGGSLGEMHAAKIAAVQEEALKVGAPMICINDSGGARIQEGVNALAGYGKIFYNNTMASGIIPQISVIMGPCAGGAVYSPALTDFVFMVDNISQMFITGPQVIKEVTGESVDAQSLGGSKTHTTISGCAHYNAYDEKDCIRQIKRLLEYLPQNNREKPQIAECTDDPQKDVPDLNSIIPENPRHAYDMRDVIRKIADNGEFMEYMRHFAVNVLTGYIRVGGRVMGVIASQPSAMAGCLDINASDKAARFIRTCDSFNIPLLTLEDVPGYLPGTKQEYGGIIRHGAKILYAYSEATVPKITVIVRKAYGGAYIGMCSKHLGADLVLAWPNAEIAVMGADGAANIIFAKDIKNAFDPAEKRRAMIEQYDKIMMNPYVAASNGFVDDVILPSETRKRVYDALISLDGKVETRPEKKHGNIPL